MSNQYPARFTRLLDELREGPDCRVLDCGSGGRKHPRITSLEIESHPNNTVQADALALPFADDSFALVLSQAVLEHVTEPQTYVDELIRVTEPGGMIHVEAAFLQPIHQAPRHFFNVTPFGLSYLFREADILEQGVMGDLQETIAWICREAGVACPSLGRLNLTPEQAWNTASGCWLTACVQ